MSQKYKVETRYVHGWGDAEWTEPNQDGSEFKPLYFDSVEAAQEEIEAHISDMIYAVFEGYMQGPVDGLEMFRVVPV